MPGTARIPPLMGQCARRMVDDAMASHADPALRLTYEDYVLFPGDGKIHEIIDGDHYLSPSPGIRHQKISRWIQHRLMDQIEKPGPGLVINASSLRSYPEKPNSLIPACGIGQIGRRLYRGFLS
jgi:hypothetical protein